MPDALLRAIRTSVRRRAEPRRDVDARIADIRIQVPEQHRSPVRRVARRKPASCTGIRDERGVFSDIWASGSPAAPCSAGGRRLAGTGRIDDPEHFIDAGFDEMVSLLSGSGGPSADELAARFEYRTSHTAKEAPPVLGPPPLPLPTRPGSRPDAARVMRATGMALGELFGSSEAPQEENLLRGLAASGGVYEGPARRVSGPSEFDRIVEGDVLVTESTSEAFNILLPLLGAIVTDSGGLLSHSAIVAREYGIPGVVGTREATDRIPDGVTRPRRRRRG